MRTAELILGRQVAVVAEPGEDLLSTVEAACREYELRQGYLPVLLGAFTDAELIGTCRHIPDPAVPLGDSVRVDNVEGSGCGTFTWDPDTDRIELHIHASLGVKRYASLGYAGHLLRARVQYPVECVLVEVRSPHWRRTPHPAAHGLPALDF